MAFDKVDLHVRYVRNAVEFWVESTDPEDRGSRFFWQGLVALGCVFGAALVAAQNQQREARYVLTALTFVMAALVARAYRSWGAAVISESLMVMPRLGIRIRKTRRNGAVSTHGLDKPMICGVAVNEAITFSNVVYSLVFMVEGQDDMVLAFETFRLRITVLQEIYKATKSRLFPDDGEEHESQLFPPDVDSFTMRLPQQVIVSCY